MCGASGTRSASPGFICYASCSGRFGPYGWFIQGFGLGRGVPYCTSHFSGRGWSTTPATHTPEQIDLSSLTLGVVPVIAPQPVVDVGPLIKPALFADEKKRLERFQRIDPSHFDGSPTVDP